VHTTFSLQKQKTPGQHLSNLAEWKAHGNGAKYYSGGNEL
jgi:hypothetical protein